MKPERQLISPDSKLVRSLIETLKCHPVIAAILANRSISSREAALTFFSPSFDQIRPPFSLKDMDKATERIISAIRRKEKMLIFGDYDTDGITSTVILYEFLQQMGADVEFHVPHRMQEGYGLKALHISGLALPRNIRLIITVDCGSDSHAAVLEAAGHGIDVIITDHHAISPELPAAVAVINPKRRDCTSGLEHLAGVGVVFYLMIAMRKALREVGFYHQQDEPNLKQYCDLVALGTVADIVPMKAENRTFTRAGLEIMGSGNRIGLKALMDTIKINCSHVDTDDIAFRLAPRLNAAGRIGHALSSVNLLMAKQMEAAFELSGILDGYNTERKTLDDKTHGEILLAIKKNPDLLIGKSLVLFHNDWHEGILGIVASRLTRSLAKPVILITVRNGVGKGSARSIVDFNLFEGLNRCRELLLGFGGHAMAAGLTIAPAHIPEFVTRFETVVQELTGPDGFDQKIMIDYNLPFKLITDKLLEELERLRPFGKDNPEPLFMAEKVKVVQSRIMGGNHRRMILKQSGDPSNRMFSAIQFNRSIEVPDSDYFESILFRLRYNRWNGKKTIQFLIEDTEISLA